MTKFYIEVLAKAQIGHKKATCVMDKIITTTLVVNGKIIKDSEQIGMYTRYDEFYEYDISEAEPLAKDEFETIDSNGEKSTYYNEHDFEIKKILEVFEEEVKYTED